MISDTSEETIVEFVDADDPMSQRLLATRTETHSGYTLEAFRALVEEHWNVEAEEELSPTRSIFSLRR